jgi:hypothetical protein
MVWIKRNLVFVILLGVAVGLLGFGISLLLSNKSTADDLNAQLLAKNSELNMLVNRDPFPNEENIQRGRQQQELLETFKGRAKEHFKQVDLPDVLDNASFKNFLENTIDNMERRARRSGVALPEDKYGFTFADQRRQLQLPDRQLAPLTLMLMDIEEVCGILFDAKIHSLTAIKRPVVGTNETVSANYHIARKIQTNSVVGAVLAPYEVTFQSFSPELARVLSGIAAHEQAIVVRFINIKPGNLDAKRPTMAMGAGATGMDPALAARYGMGPGGPGGRYGAAPGGVPGQGGRFGPPPGAGGRYGPPGGPPPGMVPPRQQDQGLDDKPIQVTLGLEIIRLLPPGAVQAEPSYPAYQDPYSMYPGGMPGY